MSKINRKIAIFIAFLTLVVVSGLLIKMPVNTNTSAPESQVAGIYIQFKDGISEPEVKDILQNINMTLNYSMEYDTNTTDERYYIIVDKDNWDIRREISKGMKEEKKEWITTSPAHVIRKGDNYVFTVSEQAVQDKKFLAILDKYNIKVKKFTWCEIHFENPDGSRYVIQEKNAKRIKNELEQNENIFTVDFSYIYPPYDPTTKETVL
ncbi:UPF0228 family protein [Methanosarcina barkeri]|uniref:Uncharacterized protein n=1 Tax=Methanosarcina barkeri CM1 TaxID=796385 RepID=A0A0G3CE54_METBA|nr:UPF0228 family protein [Methanosarcina barkeri]AKJ40176.1 hypothetical protein MCM1_3189 [Methanosarcina barkeri CM1]